jgi:hypothetical protein
VRMTVQPGPVLRDGPLDDEIFVEYQQFLVLDVGSPDHPGDLPTPTDQQPVSAGPGGVLLLSAATDHYTAVRLEAWSAAPPAPPGPFDTVTVISLDLTSGRVHAVPMTAIQSPRTLLAGPPGPYQLRACCQGRARARDAVEDYRARIPTDWTRAAADPEPFPRGVEHWLLQLWPAATRGEVPDAGGRGTARR